MSGLVRRSGGWAKNLATLYGGSIKTLTGGETMNLCVRVGDGDDYHNLDDLSGVADHLRVGNVTTPLVRLSKYGVTTDGFEGNNHISLFWGDDAA
jgi:hypothetical protein